MKILHRYITVVFAVLMGWAGLASSGQAQVTSFADLDYPYAAEYQKLANGQEIAYVDKGEGTTLILIHGLGSYIPAWKQNIPVLRKQHRVIALDLPGFGKSTKKADKYSIPFFAETIAQLQDSLRIDRAVWVGHSMGAQIAMQAALNYPNKVQKLVLLAPAGFEKFSKQDASMMRSFVIPNFIKATTDSMIRQTMRSTFFDYPEEARFMAEDRIALRNAEEFDQYARAYAASVQAMLDGPVFEKLSEIEQPALIVFGKQDALIPNRQFHPNLTTKQVAKAGHSELPNSRLLMVDKAGHFVHFERAGKVNQAILNFIDN